MIKSLFLSAILSLTSFTGLEESVKSTKTPSEANIDNKAEIDAFYAELSRTVKEGDFEGYKSTYHEDAIVIFGMIENKTSVAVSQALAGWKKGFDDTKAGKQKDNVDFRFSQRILGDNTAHDTGIFQFTSKDNEGNVRAQYTIHFEILLIKKDGEWQCMMEYQKANATETEWEALK